MTERSELLDLVIEETEEKMLKAVEHARAEFSSVRTGRASSALVERLSVEAYESTLPLQQLASFKVPEARMLMVIPFDQGTMPAIDAPDAWPDSGGSRSHCISAAVDSGRTRRALRTRSV